MSSKSARHHKKKKKHDGIAIEQKEHVSDRQTPGDRLEIVLKCDTTGCLEAVISSIKNAAPQQVGIETISSGVGPVNKSDIFMAETGSRLIIAFNVGLMPHVEQMAAEHDVEIRIYEVIYRLLDDLKSIAESLIPPETKEQIIGTAEVIALFKSSRKGIILGCEVMRGKLALGQSFRVLGAMGPLYVGRIESLHIENDAVREAAKGQRAGLKIKDFNKAKVGDLVESFQITREKHGKPWQPQGKVFYPY